MEEKKFVDRNIIHGGDKNFYIPILISFLAVYLAGRYIDQTIFDFTSVGGLGLIIFYALRFSKKDNRKFIDFLKLILSLFSVFRSWGLH